MTQLTDDAAAAAAHSLPPVEENPPDAVFWTGEHGLRLIGTGDWNDGMNRVGEHGRGESVWLGWLLGRTIELFALLNPIYHARTPEEAERYKVEPYVVAADVYSGEPHVGRSGWTWYTGSAPRSARRPASKLHLAPCVRQRTDIADPLAHSHLTERNHDQGNAMKH